MANRKLGRPTDQRMAMLRNQVTNLIWYGKIETTLARGKEVQSLAEHLVTIAMRQCDNTIEVTKKHMNDKKQVEELKVLNDSPLAWLPVVRSCAICTTSPPFRT